ncbi:MAG: hypothetical protein AAB091_05750, partial [Elusimicrobiota bacterium]
MTDDGVFLSFIHVLNAFPTRAPDCLHRPKALLISLYAPAPLSIILTTPGAKGPWVSVLSWGKMVSLARALP